MAGPTKAGNGEMMWRMEAGSPRLWPRTKFIPHVERGTFPLIVLLNSMSKAPKGLSHNPQQGPGQKN